MGCFVVLGSNCGSVSALRRELERWRSSCWLVAVFVACVGLEYAVWKENTINDERDVEGGAMKGGGIAGEL